MTLEQAKQAQRQQGIAARRALDPAQRRAADAAICARIAALPAWQQAGRVLGFASVLEGDYLGALFVDPAAQGRGIGTALLEGAREGRDLLTLSVYRKNAGALGFYLARGFRTLTR